MVMRMVNGVIHHLTVHKKKFFFFNFNFNPIFFFFHFKIINITIYQNKFKNIIFYSYRITIFIKEVKKSKKKKKSKIFK